MFAWLRCEDPHDFFVTVTATFRLFYVLVLIEHGTHCSNCGRLWGAATYLIHDRDRIFARSLDESITNLGVTVLKSPPHGPKANAI